MSEMRNGRAPTTTNVAGFLKGNSANQIKVYSKEFLLDKSNGEK